MERDLRDQLAAQGDFAKSNGAGEGDVVQGGFDQAGYGRSGKGVVGDIFGTGERDWGAADVLNHSRGLWDEGGHGSTA